MVEELGTTSADPLLMARENGTGQLIKKELANDAPEITERIHNEASKMEDCDIKNFENPQFVAQYAPEIFDYLHKIEVRMRIKGGCRGTVFKISST